MSCGQAASREATLGPVLDACLQMAGPVTGGLLNTNKAVKQTRGSACGTETATTFLAGGGDCGG